MEEISNNPTDAKIAVSTSVPFVLKKFLRKYDSPLDKERLKELLKDRRIRAANSYQM
jgi:hypothetical protein